MRTFQSAGEFYSVKMLNDSKLRKLLEQAIDWRKEKSSGALKGTQRLFSGASDGVKGLWVDRYGDLIVINLYQKELHPKLEVLKSYFLNISPNAEVLFKIKQEKGFKALTTYLDKDEFVCEEGECQYIIKTDIEHDFGLFLDTYVARDWLAKEAMAKSVLNLFSYTCAFGVVGMKHEASQVTNIDPSKEYLAWGKANAKLNRLDFRNLCDPAQKYLPRHIRRISEGKDERYDIVISDPPAFLVGRGDDRLGRKIWPKLLDWFQEMQPHQIVLICNDRSFRQTRDMRSYFTEGLGGEYDLAELHHGDDLLGQNYDRLLSENDYLPPDIYIATKN